MQTILCYHGFVQVVTDKRIENITAINRKEGMTDRRKRLNLNPQNYNDIRTSKKGSVQPYGTQVYI